MRLACILTHVPECHLRATARRARACPASPFAPSAIASFRTLLLKFRSDADGISHTPRTPDRRHGSAHPTRARKFTRSAISWKDIPAREMLRRIAGLSHAFAEMGVREGDRVAVFAPNCPEWHVADFAITGLGAVVVPIYFRESPERIAYIIGHSEAKIVFVAGVGASRAAAWPCARELPTVERIIVAGGAAGAGPTIRCSTRR